MKSFEIALKKGDIGEKIIQEYLENKGWIVYRPFTKNKAHYFDILCTFEKEKVLAIDVKTKARFNKWEAQGINVKSYNEYINFIKTTNVPFFLFFIDDKNGDVHIADVTKLDEPIYPTYNIIAWHLSKMKFIFNIGIEAINELSKFDQRNYNYNPK
jgi:hypothetical protein